MEYVDGANLKTVAESLKKQGKDFPVAAAAFIAHEICKGLTYAHELTDPNGMPLNIVHRDMSPPNVLITKFGEVKIVDFGLAKASSQLEKSEPGIIKGKFSYLSPEAAMGQDVDSRTDIFATGIILWELLAGQRLFLGDTDFQTVKKVQQAQIPPIAHINRKVPPELERIVNKSLAKDVVHRYTNARDLGQDLVRFMYAYGQAISGFDIAMIVQSTMREKQRVRPPQGSIIDKLIEEALFEFTSLKEDGQPASAGKAAAASPLNPDAFIDPSHWAKEIAIADKRPAMPAYDPVRASLPPEIFEQGNLSALEDAEPMPSSPVMPPPSTPPPSMGPAHPSSIPPPLGGAHISGGYVPARVAPRDGGKLGPGGGAAIGVVLFLVVAAAAGAAWLTGLIPHH
jgi:eukaryotic-like serine/threonine-protein kinase